MLEAYNEISPDAPQIDRLRQWLLIQRQTEDWGATLETAEVVYAILSSGSDWMVDSDPARILINGKEQTISKRDALTGSFVIPLDSDDVTVEVIKSSGHQAWGGILSRMIVPIADVKPFRVPAMVGAMMFLTGKWNLKGVRNVEEFDPDPFLEQLALNGLPWEEEFNGDLEVDKL